MEQPQNQPNFLFLVWDACRLDYAKKYADTFSDLAESNLVFQNAIAPSTWSPPSHGSIFTGQYPHEHGVYRGNDSMESVTLFSELRNRGYTTFGVSGNGFVSPATNIHNHFDQLHYTSGQGPFLDGLTIYEHVFDEINRGEEFSTFDAGLDTLRAVLTHKHPLKSLVNLSAVGFNRAAANFYPLQRIPHPIFNSIQMYNYSPRRNTKLIRRFLSNPERQEEPFFIFANYMDTHLPYYPPDDIQEDHLASPLSYPEIVRLNDDIASPVQFLAKDSRGEIDDADVETIRELYRGEVESSDRHLGILLETLEKYGLRDDTIVVVTSDHGENLGEVDEMGRRRIGHHSSMSDIVMRVPLLVAHPDIGPREVDACVSLKDIYKLFIGGHEALLSGSEGDIEQFTPDDGIVLCEYPATGGGDHLRENYPDAPDEAIALRAEHDAVAGYYENWRIVFESTGQRWAWREGDKAYVADAPSKLVNRVDDHLQLLMNLNDANREVGSAEREKLEALGYL